MCRNRQLEIPNAEIQNPNESSNPKSKLFFGFGHWRLFWILKLGFGNSAGSVLIAVIWMLAFLTVFTLSVGRRASQELLFGQRMRDRVIGRTAAQAGIERALYEIQADEFPAFDGTNENWASNDAAFKDVSLGDSVFRVSCDKVDPQNNEEITRYGVCDESARLNINLATETMLKDFFKAVLGDQTDGKLLSQLAEAIIDWRDSNDAAPPFGAERTYYKDQSTPYEPRNAPFESVDELLMVRGIDSKLFKQIDPYLTVYGDGKVNFNSAPRPVLRALGLSEGLADKVVDFRKGPDRIEGTEDDVVFQDPSTITPIVSAAMSFSSEEFAQISNAISAGFVGVKTNTFRIRSTGRLIRDDRNAELTVSCVLDRKGTILYWKEGGE